ncbi:hypothetical protein Tco_1183720 [Tanacetum coccineum]
MAFCERTRGMAILKSKSMRPYATRGLMTYPLIRLECLPSELERDLLPMTPRNLQIVSSGIKSSSRWLPVSEFATQRPTPFAVYPSMKLGQRSILIQGLPNDIYSLIDNNDIAQELCDALERQMRGSEDYGNLDLRNLDFQNTRLRKYLRLWNLDFQYSVSEVFEWRERLMNYLVEETDGELLIRFITHGEQPLPVVTQVSLAGTVPNALHVLKDPKFWTAEEKRIRKIDRLARFRRWSNHLIPAPSDSLPHAHTQASKTYNWHQKFKKSGKLITYKDKDLPRDSKENWYIKGDC